MTESYEKRRLGIFAMYDKEGIVDYYITFLLHSLKPYLDELIIVCNGELREEEAAKLKYITDKIVIRENSGYDVTAWKIVLCKLIEQGEMDAYDEVLLCNDSFFGPIYPWEEMFQAMEHQEVDFWGMTRHPKSYEAVRGHIPEHLQSFFLVIRKPMLCSDAFYQYWKGIQLQGKTLLDAIVEHELRFTEFFAKKGYKWKAYVDTSVLENDTNERLNFNAYYFSPLELIRDCYCPILKKKALVDKNLHMVAGEEAKLVLEYIEKETSFDTSLIWENLIRIMPKNQLHTAFQMQYVTADMNCQDEYITVQCCLFVMGESRFDLEKLIRQYDLNDMEIKQIEKLEDMNSYLNEERYGIIGLLDFSSVKASTPMEGLLRTEDLLENMLGTLEYVKLLFKENKYLGILYPNIRPIRIEAADSSIFQQSFWCRSIYLREKDKFLYGTICTKRYAEEQLCSFDNQFIKLSNIGQIPDIFNQKDILDNQEFREYLNRKEKFYVYGTGIYGRRIAAIMKKENKTLLAFVVSDGQPTGEVEGEKVITISTLCSERVQDSGLIVALSKKVQLEVQRNIKNSGIMDILYL